MATCGDELCNGLKYVLDQGMHQQQNQQQQQQQNQQNEQQQYHDPEMATSPFSTEEASTAAASAVTAEKQETAPSTDNTSTGYYNTTAASAVSRNSKYTDQEIKATVLMISGCQDSQTSADVSNVSSFTLPDPNGRAGGACTSALLQGTLFV